MARALPKTTTPLRPRWYLLRSVRLECDNQRVQLPTRQVESLLTFLALHFEPQSLDQIAARLWGKASDEALRRARWLSSMPA